MSKDITELKDFREAEETFLKAMRGEPTVEPIPNFKPQVRVRERKIKKFRPIVEARKALSKLSTLDYFKSILSDETERQLWMAFITGKMPKLGPAGKPETDDQGNIIMIDVELNPISWNAFRRAVEYKRGMPLVTVEDNTKGESKTVEIIMIGSNPNLFREQAEAQGLLGIKKTEPKVAELEDSKV